ncbi:diphthamide biosynthesis protein [Pyrobaculum islandicum DSM 4184]|uniref:2-(3-amino-3-carboxypropyl)histidine synthase n=1 Tax=Pyrobaculum islandicum (strain DSM 4184 / JCM 9189 / GEO3) TaxID=384616 RepID=A1RRI9_PYRIL|nr:diphthamide biosynthesis enzyme Dph2 [Pyrobaculum islandicum]ABL87571.1 diphthamide biosynthesis protein [Pyrobaculum islandicum DSM 4184]
MEHIEVHPFVWKAGPDTLIEAPPGFKWVAMEIARKTGATVSGRPVWGACDIRPDPRFRKIFHLGHSVPPNVAYLLQKNLGGEIERVEQDFYRFKTDGTEIYFIPVYYKPPPDLPRLEKVGKIYFPLPYRKIAEVIHKETGFPIARDPVTGCWVGEQPGDVAYVVSTGLFYPLTLKFFYPDTTVYLVDPFRREVKDIEPEFMRLIKLKARAHISTPKRVAVLLTTKPGQRQDDKALELSSRGLVMVLLDEISPEYIDDLQFDLVVNTACPRIGIDDIDRIKTPILNYYEYKRGVIDPRLSIKLI